MRSCWTGRSAPAPAASSEAIAASCGRAQPAGNSRERLTGRPETSQPPASPAAIRGRSGSAGFPQRPAPPPADMEAAAGPRRALARLAVACCLVVAAQAAALDPGAGADLLKWITLQGGQATVNISNREGSAVPVVTAAKDFAENEVVAAIPAACSIVLGNVQASYAEEASNLITKRFTLPNWFTYMNPYFATWPPSAEVFNQFTMSDSELALLQDDKLAGIARAAQASLNPYFNGGKATVGGEMTTVPSLANATGTTLPLDFLKYTAAVIETRSFVYAGTTPGAAAVPSATRFLIPLLDLIEHHTDETNVRVQKDGSSGAFYVVATTNISAGDELAASYRYGNRNDQTLLKYDVRTGPATNGKGPAATPGFIDEASKLLAASDLPDGYNFDYPDNDGFLDARRGGRLGTAQEAGRLQSILSGFPTTEAQDAALLQGNTLGGRDALAVAFRRQRKAALAGAVRTIHDSLAAQTAAGAPSQAQLRAVRTEAARYGAGTGEAFTPLMQTATGGAGQAMRYGGGTGSGSPYASGAASAAGPTRLQSEYLNSLEAVPAAVALAESIPAMYLMG